MEVIPEALPKFSRLTGGRGGVRLVEMGQNSDCLKKKCLKTAFLSSKILDHLTLERASTPVLQINYHGYHGRGTKGIWGDQRVLLRYTVFLKERANRVIYYVSKTLID